jgi:hypothetical protein
MEDIIDLVVTDASPSEISDAIKSALFTKAGEKIEGLKPEVAASLFGTEYSDESEVDTNYQEEE